MTAVSPSRVRALASGPASSDRPATTFAASVERKLLGRGVVAADEGVLVGSLAEVRRGDRVEAGDDRSRDEILDTLGEGARVRVGAARRPARR